MARTLRRGVDCPSRGRARCPDRRVAPRDSETAVTRATRPSVGVPVLRRRAGHVGAARSPRRTWDRGSGAAHRAPHPCPRAGGVALRARNAILRSARAGARGVGPAGRQLARHSLGARPRLRPPGRAPRPRRRLLRPLLRFPQRPLPPHRRRLRLPAGRSTTARGARRCDARRGDAGRGRVAGRA